MAEGRNNPAAEVRETYGRREAARNRAEQREAGLGAEQQRRGWARAAANSRQDDAEITGRTPVRSD